MTVAQRPGGGRAAVTARIARVVVQLDGAEDGRSVERLDPNRARGVRVEGVGILRRHDHHLGQVVGRGHTGQRGVITQVHDGHVTQALGGGIGDEPALGHPLGGTGAILTTKAVHELQRSGGEYAIVSMCCGGGLGTGTLLQRV